MAVGDMLRQLALQHLAGGGSAEELHDGLKAIAPPDQSTLPPARDDLPHRALSAIGDGIRNFTSNAESTPGVFGSIAAGAHRAASSVGDVLTGPPVSQRDVDAALANFTHTASPAAAHAPTPAASPAGPQSPLAPPLSADPAAGQPGNTALPGGLGHVAASGVFGEDAPYNPEGFADLATGRRHERGMLDASKALGEAADKEGQAKAEEMRLRGEQLEAETPIREQQLKDADAHAKSIQEIEAAGQARLRVQMAKYQSASDEAAQAQVHNFFDDKTTGASIMAVISQALSGAANGLAGNPGAPTPLDRIIERDLQMQKVNLDQKNKNADRQGNMLSVLREELGSETLAENAFYQASLTKSEAMLKQLAPYYAGGVSSAQAQQALAQIAEKKAQAQQQAQAIAMQTDTQRAEAELRLGMGQQASKSVAFAALAKANAKHGEDFHFQRGFKGVIAKGEISTSGQKLSQGYYGIMGSLANIHQALREGMSLEQYNKLLASDPIIYDAAHKMGYLRPNQQQHFVDMLKPSYTGGNFDIMGQKERLDNVMMYMANQYREQALGLNPYRKDVNEEGLVPDYDDPVMGRHWRKFDTQRENSKAVFGDE